MQHLNLASGTSFFKSPEQASAAAMAVLQERENFYNAAEGTEELRNAVAGKYKNEGMAIEADQVLITSGSKSALHTLFSVLLQEGDEVVIPTPAWFGFHELVKYSKGSLVTIPTSFADQYSLKPEALRAVLHGKSRILLLTNPANPTGRIYKKEELEAILAAASEFPDLYIICDEIYDYITYSRPFTSILSCQGPQERCLIVNGFSKSFAMTSWRVGYVVGAREIIEKCIAYQFGTLSGISPILQAGALATLQHRSTILATFLPVLEENRLAAIEAMAQIPHVTFFQPEGAYYLFPDFSHFLGTQTSAGKKIYSAIDLCKYLEQDYSLTLSPGDYFGAPGHARMSFAIEPAELQEAIKRLKQALAELEADHL
ncbi:pyridoxal phosphate-dependent aminotransferase [Pontibacter sp. SGAir0037]|uniref:pyridoxal phosphate-dependent aminotransferase n=1 Tax=Pontibacter sp. SGAir0037 TaxID=2571030 RepID=UPI0010CD0A49|nr:aminotransferase class I/II-fold pyridoxal phosphate-dependent enzyme [Pontibacter sp. SGAir0037]QCR21744.1 hypothetical protein C1N53_04900 [Pontibacter sp. SGAir0037]